MANLEIIKTKTTGNYKLIAVKKTQADGTITFGFGTAKRGGKWKISYGLSLSQAIRKVHNHNAVAHNPNILVG